MNSGKLIGIGYWKYFTQPELPLPTDFINNTVGAEERNLVVSYLQKGKVWVIWKGWSYCRFDCGTEDAEIGHACLTDGKYVWPEGLSHYIKRHEVWLPDGFINHVKANVGKDWAQIEVDNFDSEVDMTWWKEVKLL